MQTPHSWEQTNNQLRKTFEFEKFEDAIAWINTCSIDIVRLDHHPHRTNQYNKVSIVLTTHDAGNTITDLDRQLASLMDEHYQAYQSTDRPG
jgi:4a-hydroxytetrahydrobiopterin dehydratase